MIPFITRRLLLLAPILFGVSIVVFGMVHLTPGDPVQIMLGTDASPVQAQTLRHELGLDRPLLVQYGLFIGDIAHGNLGQSIVSRRLVTQEIADRLPATLQLTAAAMAIAVILGVTIGTIAAATRSQALESTLMLGATMGVSMPTFWIGLLFIYSFALQLGWFPVLGGADLKGTVLPALTLALPGGAVLARVTRSSLADVLHQDYIRTALAKGLSWPSVVRHHAMRNGLIVVLTIVGLQFGGLLAGSVIVETVFARPGIGSFAVGAIQARDYPVIQGITLVFSLFYVLINLVLDILYSVIDPQIRIS
ncbi:MAG: ABC transporter permease [Chloroflexota bacterium]